jgi:hypothetical protein
MSIDGARRGSIAKPPDAKRADDIGTSTGEGDTAAMDAVDRG